MCTFSIHFFLMCEFAYEIVRLALWCAHVRNVVTKKMATHTAPTILNGVCLKKLV